MRHALCLAGSLLALLLSLDARAADLAPRDVVSGVAKAIEDHYYDANRGKDIADGLRSDASQGRFDALQDPRDLATALTGRLKPLDAHFAVRWSPPGAGAAKSAPAVMARHARSPADDGAARSNFGIRRVEVWPGNVGYIDLREFADFEFGVPDAPARRAIEAALQLVAHADALIIDLRNNGGGSPAMVGYLASAFTPKGADIYNTFHSRGGTQSEAPRDWYPNPRLDVPLYVLTSGRTGSAAEAFAYTLKNAGRATLVGEASGGAANPGGMVDVGSGFSVFVSSGSPVSPITGRNWEGDGVAPDVPTSPDAAPDKAQALALAAILKRAAPGAEVTDTRWALEALLAHGTAPETGPLAQYVGHYDAVTIGEQDGRLSLRRGRRPPLFLQALGDGVFSVDGDSSQRVRFERDAQGKVIALETLWADGNASRYRRVEAAL